MASNRHLGRIIALQTLFEQDFHAEILGEQFDLGAVLQRNIDRYKATVDDVDFIKRLVHGVSERLDELDKSLQPLAPEWPISQIARMDRIVLRIGIYELTYEKDVPAKVVINEAVELAKAFANENSSRFVNGVLGTALRKKEGSNPETTIEPSKEETDETVKTESVPNTSKPKERG